MENKQEQNASNKVMDETCSDKTILPFRKKVAFVMILSVIFFIILEIVGHMGIYILYGYFLPASINQKAYSKFSVYGIHRHIPHKPIRLRSLYPCRSLGVDQYGFVHNGYEEKINADIKILVLGGSTIEGRGASSNAFTIPALLEKLARKEFPQKTIRFYNGGISGYQSYQQRCLLDDPLIQSFQFDIVMAIDGRNDAYYSISFADFGWKENWNPYFDEITQGVNSIIVEGNSFELENFLNKYSALAVLIKRLSQSVKKSVHPQITKPERHFLAKSVDNYIRNHKITSAHCKILGARYFVFIQPVIKEGTCVITKREKKIIDEWEKHYHDTFYWQSLYEWFDIAIEKTGKDSRFTDITQIFQDEQLPVYHDSCHYTDLGNQKIAEKVFGIIKQEIHNRLENSK